VVGLLRLPSNDGPAPERRNALDHIEIAHGNANDGVLRVAPSGSPHEGAFALKQASEPKEIVALHVESISVGVAGIEPAASRTQTARAAYCATPREVVPGADSSSGEGGNRTPDAEIFSLPLYRTELPPHEGGARSWVQADARR
jgi:hypothetical protein